jgi:hypothetical protein
MGKTQVSGSRLGVVARSAAGVGAVASVIALLAGCAVTDTNAGVGTEASAASAPVTQSPTPRSTEDPSDIAEEGSVAYTCGKYGGLYSLELVTRWHLDQGFITPEAYGQFLDRQAFQISRLGSPEPELKLVTEGLSDFLATAPRTPEGWAYDSTSTQWNATAGAVNDACETAGYPVTVMAEPAMGG